MKDGHSLFAAAEVNEVLGQFMAVCGGAGAQDSDSLLGASGAVRDVDQDRGDEPVLNVRPQQAECLVVPAAPGEQPRVEVQCQRVPVLHT